jgi:hypothetical protein
LFVIIGGLILAICFPAARRFVPWFLNQLWRCLSCKSFQEDEAKSAGKTATAIVTSAPLTGDIHNQILQMQVQLDTMQRQLIELRGIAATANASTPVTVSGRYRYAEDELEMHGLLDD